MHICFISQEYPKKGAVYGGIGTFLKTFTHELASVGHQITVVGIGNVSREEVQQDNGVTVVTLPESKSKLFSWKKNFKTLEQYLTQLHSTSPIDIVESSELNLAFLHKIDGVNYVIRLHGGHHFFAEGENRKVNKWKGFQEKRSFAKADGFIAVSEYVKIHTGKLLSFHSKPLEVINYPVPFEKFYTANPKKVVSGRLVFAGTVCEKKGIRQLIAALPQVAKSFPEVHLEVYGRDWKFPEGKLFTEYLKESFSTELMERVTFHGPVNHDDLPRFYEQGEICIFPSHMETQGLVAPEAMSMGKPVIFTKMGPGPETIDHGVNGWLCDPFSPDHIAEVLLEAFSKREDYPSISRKAQDKVWSKFEPKMITQKNLNFYKKLMAD